MKSHFLILNLVYYSIKRDFQIKANLFNRLEPVTHISPINTFLNHTPQFKNTPRSLKTYESLSLPHLLPYPRYTSKLIIDENPRYRRAGARSINKPKPEPPSTKKKRRKKEAKPKRRAPSARYYYRAQHSCARIPRFRAGASPLPYYIYTLTLLSPWINQYTCLPSSAATALALRRTLIYIHVPESYEKEGEGSAR